MGATTLTLTTMTKTTRPMIAEKWFLTYWGEATKPRDATYMPPNKAARGETAFFARSTWGVPTWVAQAVQNGLTRSKGSLCISLESLQVSPYSQRVHLRAQVYRVLRILTLGVIISLRRSLLKRVD